MKSTKEVLSDCLGQAIGVGSALKFDAKYLGHLCAVTLYMSMLELTADILDLDREGPKPGIPIIARSILEAYVELKNLTEDSEYLGVIQRTWVLSWLNLLKSAKAGNQYLTIIASATDLDSDIEIRRV